MTSERGTLCYSSASPGGSHRLGSPHYSYRFAEQKFIRSLQDMRIDTHRVAMPEYYSAEIAYEKLPTFGGLHVHLIFRSTEAIRVLKRGYNIACFAWEFPHLKDTTERGEHPFRNQKRMLALCEEVWVPCTYTRDVLERHGLGNVHTIPSPIVSSPEPRLPRLDILARIGHVDTACFFTSFLGSDGANRRNAPMPLYASGVGTPQRRIYLSVFNPEDFRKNLDAMVRGFDAFVQRGHDDILIIKALTGVERFSLDEVIKDVMLAKLDRGSVCEFENIIVFNAFLSDDEMRLLYDLADFYLCTSLAEGQNLPLLEAMARGVVPVTTRNTAMLDYIDEDNAVVIETSRRPNTCAHLAGNIAGKPYDVEICSPHQVTAALEASAALSKWALARKGAAARDSVAARYSHDRLQGLIEARLRAITSATGPVAVGQKHEVPGSPRQEEMV